MTFLKSACLSLFLGVTFCGTQHANHNSAESQIKNTEEFFEKIVILPKTTSLTNFIELISSVLYGEQVRLKKDSYEVGSIFILQANRWGIEFLERLKNQGLIKAILATNSLISSDHRDPIAEVLQTDAGKQLYAAFLGLEDMKLADEMLSASISTLEKSKDHAYQEESFEDAQKINLDIFNFRMKITELRIRR